MFQKCFCKHKCKARHRDWFFSINENERKTLFLNFQSTRIREILDNSHKITFNPKMMPTLRKSNQIYVLNLRIYISAVLKLIMLNGKDSYKFFIHLLNKKNSLFEFPFLMRLLICIVES